MACSHSYPVHIKPHGRIPLITTVEHVSVQISYVNTTVWKSAFLYAKQLGLKDSVYANTQR